MPDGLGSALAILQSRLPHPPIRVLGDDGVAVGPGGPGIREGTHDDGRQEKRALTKGSRLRALRIVLPIQVRHPNWAADTY